MCLSFLGLRLSNIRPGPKPNDLPFLDNHILQPIYLPFICQNPNILPGGQSIHICRTVAFVPDFQSFSDIPLLQMIIVLCISLIFSFYLIYISQKKVE